MTSTDADHGTDRLRPELHAEDHIWHDEIDRLLHHIEADAITTLNGRYAVLDGIYEHIGVYAPYPDTTEESYSFSRHHTPGRESCTFEFHVEDRENLTYWMKEVNTIDVKYTQTWNDACDVDPDDTTENPEKKYAVGGLLVDPIVTRRASHAASHIEEQLEAVSERLQFLSEFERVTHHDFRNDKTDPESYTNYSSPVNVRGVGEKTAQSLARYFGVPSNIVMHGEYGAGRFLSTSWGTRPNREGLYENVVDTTARYYDFYKQGHINATLTPDELFTYPKEQPFSRYSHRDLHHITDS